jgi:hypothetical protein
MDENNTTAELLEPSLPGSWIVEQNRIGQISLLRAKELAQFCNDQEHIEELDAEICTIVQNAREGKILLSLSITGPIQAAMIIAAIENILNFPSAAKLKSYFGWAPKREQTGTSYDRSSLSHAGTRIMKQIMFLIAISATRLDNEWARIYERLVPIKCGYDERTRSHKGKLKIIGRIAGQIIEMIYALLKKDAEVLSKVPPGAKPLESTLYNREIHQAHRQGKYYSLKSLEKKEKIVLLPKSSP